MDYYRLGISEARKILDKKEVSARELLDSIYQRIESVEDKVKAYVTLPKEKAYEMADMSQKKISSGQSASLSGIPIAIKDNMCTKGIRTTCSSKILSNFIPPYESTVTSRLKENGFNIIGHRGFSPQANHRGKGRLGSRDRPFPLQGV